MGSLTRVLSLAPVLAVDFGAAAGVLGAVVAAAGGDAARTRGVPRSLASSLSPAPAGVLLAGPLLGLPLVICGLVKIAYDVARLISFRHIKSPEELSLRE